MRCRTNQIRNNKRLISSGSDEAQLIAGVETYLDMSTTASNVEKGHKSAAIMTDEVSTGMSISRIINQGVLNSMRKRIMPSAVALQMNLLDKQIGKLERKKPQRMAGNCVLLQPHGLIRGVYFKTGPFSEGLPQP